MDPGATITIPRRICSRFTPRNKAPMLSPASPRSSSLWNISTPVKVVLKLAPRPMISTSEPLVMTPRSTRPVATVPRPEMEKTSTAEAIRRPVQRHRSCFYLQRASRTASRGHLIIRKHVKNHVAKVCQTHSRGGSSSQVSQASTSSIIFFSPVS
jgi:hypothetical protein